MSGVNFARISKPVEFYKQQNGSYFCQSCDYITSYKKDFNRHLKSKKHLRGGAMCKGDLTCQNCNKQYKHYTSYARHIAKCSKKGQKISQKGQKCSIVIEDTKEKSETILLKQKIKLLEQELKQKEVKDLKKELEHKNKILEKTEKMVEILKEGKTINNNNYNNCNNKNLTVNVYLSEHCKNAMNLTDFVNQIQVQLEDVMYQKDFGATAGIQNILTKQLENLDPTDRPIHCTDEKRMQFYVKDEGKWEKDTGDKAAKDIRTKIKDKSIMAMKEWEDANPTFPNNPKLAEEYNKIVSGILEGYGDKKKFDKQIQEVKKRIARYVSIKDAIEQKEKIEDK